MKILLRGAFIFLFINTVIFFSYENKMAYTPETLHANGDVVIILGSSVKGNKLSQIVQDRTEMAIEVYEQEKAPKILISGDGDSEDPYYNEVETILKYLINRGIPAGDIILDNAGYDTYDSLRRAKHTFAFQHVVISTQRFHLPRTLLIAQGIGLDAEGIIADRTIYPSAARNSFRETFARMKAIYDILVKSEASTD